jgi:hypothetical protein
MHDLQNQHQQADNPGPQQELPPWLTMTNAVIAIMIIGFVVLVGKAIAGRGLMGAVRELERRRP